MKELLGETTTVEKKGNFEVSKPKSWLKSVSAFANGKGGKLIFGILEDNTVIGIEDYQGTLEKISELIQARMDPVPTISLETEVIDDKVILILEVKEGTQKPYYYVDSGSCIAFKRVGNQSSPFKQADFMDVGLHAKHLTYDALESRLRLEDVTFKEFGREYKKLTLNEFVDSNLSSFKFVNSKGKLTVAGSLFADGNVVQNSKVFCTRWNGKDKVNGRMEAFDDLELEGNLLYLLNNTLDFIRRNSKKKWKKYDTVRMEFPDYPMRAVQEVIVNALVHRDYSMLGSEVHVDMYDDRMEVYSPGGMFDEKCIQDTEISMISSKRRNPIVAEVFTRLKYMERRASGLLKIFEDYETQTNYSSQFEPVFKSDDFSFVAILKNLNYQNDDGLGDEKKEKPTQNERKAEIIMLINNNKTITANEIANLQEVSPRTIERDLSDMVKDGLIKYDGSPKSGRWSITKKGQRLADKMKA